MDAYETADMDYESQTMGHRSRVNKAFTLIELAAAVGILAMVLSFAGVIFKVSINSHRTAIANAEIMQKLRAITDQLNADFAGVRRDRGGYITFGFDSSQIDGRIVQAKSDNIAFFANGDFQSTRQYDRFDPAGNLLSHRTVPGNIACIFYSMLDPNSYGRVPEPREKILVRRQTVLTADQFLSDADSNPRGEYYKMSLSDWRVVSPFADPNDWAKKPFMNVHNLRDQDLAMYMAKGVDDFTIQFAPRHTPGPVQWWPIGANRPQKINPRAFKFTFKLYDSKGVIERGRTFTHIVYLGD